MELIRWPLLESSWSEVSQLSLMISQPYLALKLNGGLPNRRGNTLEGLTETSYGACNLPVRFLLANEWQNILVLAKYYNRITLARVSELLSLPSEVRLSVETCTHSLA